MPVGNTSTRTNDPAEKLRGRYLGIYWGFVRDRADPMKKGRVRVYVPGIVPTDSPQGWLDWCEASSAWLAVPPLNAPVRIEFEMGHIQYGIYTWAGFRGETPETSEVPEAGKGLPDATWLPERRASSGGFGDKINVTLPADTAAATPPVYPYNKVFKSENGHILELDDSPGALRARYCHPSGTSILIDADGSVHIRARGGHYLHTDGDYQVLLGEGSSFKVVYPDGSGLNVGPTGVDITGYQARILGRAVTRAGVPLGDYG